MAWQANDEWFEALYRRYYRSIVAYFIRTGFLREEARELAQDTFLRVYRGMKGYQGGGDFAFLKETAVNVGLNSIRARLTKKRQATVVPLELVPDIAAGAVNPTAVPPPATPEAEASLREETVAHRRWLQQAIAALPAARRDCLLLRLGGLKYRDIARVMGIPIDTVKARLHETRRTLSEKYRAGAGAIEWPPELEDDEHG